MESHFVRGIKMNEQQQINYFRNDPVFREREIKKIHAKIDKEHNRQLSDLKKEMSSLPQQKQQEIARRKKFRINSYANGRVQTNRVEGYILIDNVRYKFADIQGARIESSFDTYVSETKSTGKTKKKVSLGGAVVGGMLAGPVGAAAGAAMMGGSKYKGDTQAAKVETVEHYTVLINVRGFETAIAATSADDAQRMVDELRRVSQMPQPTKIIPVEEEEAVKAFDVKWTNLQQKIKLMENTPIEYSLGFYKPQEFSEMTDQEYLVFLEDKDKEREAEKEANKTEKEKERDRRREERKENVSKFRGKIPNILFVLLRICLISFFAVLAIGSYQLTDYYSTLLIILCIILTPRFVRNRLEEKFSSVPSWGFKVLIVVLFVLSLLVAHRT